MHLNKIINRPIVTEKSSTFQENDEFVFRVDVKATKGAITKAIKDAFDVDVKDVRTMIMPGKRKRVGKTSRFTKTKRWKKAIVRLQDGQSIDIFAEGK